ncbi:unnamed protein product [Prunus armeniaca]
MNFFGFLGALAFLFFVRITKTNFSHGLICVYSWVRVFLSHHVLFDEGTFPFAHFELTSLRQDVLFDLAPNDLVPSPSPQITHPIPSQPPSSSPLSQDRGRDTSTSSAPVQELVVMRESSPSTVPLEAATSSIPPLITDIHANTTTTSTETALSTQPVRHQMEGLDYSETFSPVVKHTTIHMVLGLAMSNKWHVRQLDVQNAFLHGFLTEDVYMWQPASFVSQSRLQAAEVMMLIQRLGKLFSMKDLDRLNYFLGIAATYEGSMLHLTQKKYASDLLTRTGFADCKPISTPCISGQKLSLHSGEPLMDPSEYCQVVSALQYLTITQPDLSYAVNQVCQFMHSPTTLHWQVVKCIMRYLKATYDHGLRYQPGNRVLNAYSDADYAGDPDTRHSTGGFCVYFGSNLISWSSKKQKTVSRSSTEAEYRQLAYTAAELSWLHSIFRDLCIFLPTPTLRCDNVSSIALASNPVFHSRTKHLEVDYHYVREKVIRGELRVNYICSQDQVTDLFTKGLSSSRFKALVFKLPVLQGPLSLRGAIRPRSDVDKATGVLNLNDSSLSFGSFE